MPRGDLFPEISPFETGYLPLADEHVMYWEQVGNPHGKPVLFLHGGPGAGAGAVHRRFFDPAIWRAIIFDQRGSGRSKPLGSLTGNTTPNLIADIETLREDFSASSAGCCSAAPGSSTLALAYAQAHPEAVAGAVLRGIFLGRATEVDWFLHGMARVFHPTFMPLSRNSCRRQSAATCWATTCAASPTPTRKCMGPPPIAGASMRGSCSTLLPSFEAVSTFGARPHPRPSAWRASRRIISRMTCSCPKAGCSRTWQHCTTSTAKSCRGATT